MNILNDKRLIFPITALISLLLLVHGSAALVSYGYNDDFHMLFDSLTGSFPVWDHAVTRDGRLLSALFVKTVFSQLDGIGDLRWARVLSVMGICLSGTFFFWMLIRGGFSRIFAFTLSLVTFTTPAFAVYSSWAVCFTYPTATLSSLVGGWLCFRVFFCELRLRDRILFSLAAWGTIVAAYWIYQPLGPFCLLSLLALSWRNMDLSRSFLLRSIGCLLFFGLSTVSYLVLNSLTLKYFGATLSGRVSLLTDYGDRISYLLKFSFPAIAAGWGALLGQKTAIYLSLVLLAIIIAGLSVGRKSVSLVRFLTGGLVFALSVAIFALPNEIYLAYRLYAVPSAVVLFLLWTALWKLWESPPGWMPGAVRPLAWFPAVAFLLSWIVAGHYWSYYQLQKLNAEELAAIREEAERKLSEWPERLQVILPAPYERKMTDVFVAEFKTRSSHMPWVAPRMFQLALYEELFPEKTILEAQKAFPRFELYFALESDSRTPMLDLFSVVHGSETEWAQHPLFGNCRKVTGLEYYSSPTFGVFDNTEYPYIYHLALGWVYVEAAEDGLVVLMDHGNRKAVLKPDLFPVVSFPETDTQMRLDPFIGFGQRLH